MSSKYSLPVNHPSFKDPSPQVRRSQPVTPAKVETEYSWLGRWVDNGYAVRIHPRLTEEQWAPVYKRGEDLWDNDLGRYSEVKTIELLAELFPTHELVIVWPKCTHRTRSGELRDGSGAVVRPWYTVCGQVAKHTALELRDVYDNRMAVPRCARHQGQL